jgi:hypothetical protein
MEVLPCENLLTAVVLAVGATFLVLKWGKIFIPVSDTVLTSMFGSF